MTTRPAPSPRAILSAEEHAMLADVDVSKLQFDQAAKLTGLHPDILRKLVRDGVLDGVVQPRTGEGVCDIAQARQIADRLHAARRPVEGQGIIVTAASEKYGFTTSTLYKWHQDNWLKVLGTTDSGDRLFNEGDVAFARALADLVGHLPGRAVFPAKPRSGRPPKQRP